MQGVKHTNLAVFQSVNLKIRYNVDLVMQQKLLNTENSRIDSINVIDIFEYCVMISIIHSPSAIH